MSEQLEWISPAKAAKMLKHDTQNNTADFSFATLPNLERKDATAVLARAKLQPRRPGPGDQWPAPFWPVTSAADRMIFAPNAAVKDMCVETVLADYDAHVLKYQSVLAVVLTMQFGHDWQVVDMLSLTTMFLTQNFALKRQLTSLLVVHNPAVALSAQPPHAHCVVLARKHRAAGWSEVHQDLVAKDAGSRLASEWLDFREKWAPSYRYL